jgi:hypothetical protein
MDDHEMSMFIFSSEIDNHSRLFILDGLPSSIHESDG